MNADAGRAARILLLASGAACAAFAVARLPSPRILLRAPSTPYDRTETSGAAPAFRFLSRAAAVLPAGAVAAVHAEPRDPVRETTLHFYGVALLPGRRVLPAAAWDLFTPDYDAQAAYLVVIGPPPVPAPGRLLLSDPDGSLWKRTP